jgi:hypothetical protein
MNNTINYPYLTGYLQAELQNLATDKIFLKMKSEDDRLKYVRLIIEGANIKAKMAKF